MKKTIARSFLALALAACLLPIAVHAQLQITEVQSSEVGSGHADWWELSNFGPLSVNFTGYRFDDDSSNVVLNAVLLPSLTIAPGESVIFVEGLSYSTFTNWWGLNPSVQVGTYSGSGVSLGSGGDQVNLFDSSSNIVDHVILGAATAGHTFDQFDPVTRISTHQSVNGVNNAFTTTDGNIGSPGIAPVPEPATATLAGLGLAVALSFHRRNRKS